MNCFKAYRGYAYVKYTTEDEADCAMEVLSHFYIAPKRKLEILHSYEKCCLFISNIPKHLEEKEIEEKLRAVFPTMQRLYSRRISSAPKMCYAETADSNVCYDAKQKSSNGSFQIILNTASRNEQKNRGSVFVHFATHLEALEAKKSTTPGVIRLWDRDLKVVWANTERNTDMSKSVIIIFSIRNSFCCFLTHRYYAISFRRIKLCLCGMWISASIIVTLWIR